MQTIKKSFPKIHLCAANDDLRPTLSHIYCEKLEEGIQGNAGYYFVATNGHVLTWFNLSDCIDTTIESLPDGFYIDPKQYKKLTGKKVDKIAFDLYINSFFTYDKAGNQLDMVPVIAYDKIGQFPKWLNVIREAKPGEAVAEIGVNGEYLYAISEIFDFKAIHFYFDSCIKGVLCKQVTEENSLRSLIMPVEIRKG